MPDENPAKIIIIALTVLLAACFLALCTVAETKNNYKESFIMLRQECTAKGFGSYNPTNGVWSLK